MCLNFDFGHLWQWKGQTNNRCSEDSMTLLPIVFFVCVSDRWQKLNRSPVCFGAKGNKFGNFSAPAGRLAAIKLVYLYGYVSCSTNVSSYWSYWGCGVDPRNAKNTHRQVNVVITNSSNHILLPPNQLISDVTMKWYTIPGYNSLSPELVLSVFLNPISLSSNQVLRLWYGEDLANHKEEDNGGRVCADVYSTYDWKDSMLLQNLYTI